MLRKRTLSDRPKNLGQDIQSLTGDSVVLIIGFAFRSVTLLLAAVSSLIFTQ